MLICTGQLVVQVNMSLIIRLHQFVRLDHFRKTFDLGRMAPRLELDLLPHNACETSSPAFSRVFLNHALDSVLVHQLWIFACVVEDGRKVC